MRKTSMSGVMPALALVGAVGLLSLGCDSPSSLQAPQSTGLGDQPAPTVDAARMPVAQVYMADLEEQNGSGMRGKATIRIGNNGEFAVIVNANGHVPFSVHPQHIHGFLDGTASSCPTAAADADGDSFVSVGEGVPFYGGVLVPLDGSLDVAEGLGDPATFPTADNAAGAISYRQVIPFWDLALNGGASPSSLMLENHAIVLHGAFMNGSYVVTLPVACGTLRRVN